MNLINDVDFKTRRDRTIGRAFDDITDIINACITGGIHLKHINMTAGHNRLAWLASTARVQGWPACAILADTIQALGKNTCGRGFAHTAHACQHKGMCKPAMFNRILKCFDKRVLADEACEIIRTIFARKDTVS